MAGVGPQPGIGTISNQQHGFFWNGVRRGNVYRGASQSPVATALTAGLTTTYTGGLMLYNPVGSGVNLSILGAAFGFVVAQTNAAVIGLGVGYSLTAPTGTLTAVPIQNALVGSTNVAKGKLYSSASITLPIAPVQATQLSSVATGALTTSPGSGLSPFDVDGSLELAPGAYCIFTSSATGTASSFMGSYFWEEITPGP